MDDINNAGAIYTDLPAVIDSKIITTAHYKDMGPWMKAVLDEFKNLNNDIPNNYKVIKPWVTSTLFIKIIFQAPNY